MPTVIRKTKGRYPLLSHEQVSNDTSFKRHKFQMPQVSFEITCHQFHEICFKWHPMVTSDVRVTKPLGWKEKSKSAFLREVVQRYKNFFFPVFFEHPFLCSFPSTKFSSFTLKWQAIWIDNDRSLIDFLWIVLHNFNSDQKIWANINLIYSLGFIYCTL